MFVFWSSAFINPRRACAARVNSVTVVGLCVCRRLFSHYRLRGGLGAIPTASVLQGHENNVAILLKRLRSRDMA